MTGNDLSYLQRYLVEEEAEHWREGSISRREFVRRVTLLVGGAAAAGSILLSLGCDTSTPEPTPTSGLGAATVAATPQANGNASPYHVGPNDTSVQSEIVDIVPSSDPALKLKGYRSAKPDLAGHAPTKMGGVLVVHENKGLTDYIKDVTRRVAKAGYVGLCVDLLSRAGGSDAHPDETERTGILGQIPPEKLISDLSAGLDFLKAQPNVDPAKVGAIGFCFGGGLTWIMATRRPDLKAAVPFYGPNPPLDTVQNIKAAVLGIYGGQDTRITGAVPQLEDALKSANVAYQIKIYDDANHAFHNDTGANYNAKDAADAWEQTLAWLSGHM